MKIRLFITELFITENYTTATYVAIHNLKLRYQQHEILGNTIRQVRQIT